MILLKKLHTVVICKSLMIKSKYDLGKGPSIKDVSPNFRFLGYPPSPCLLKSTSECLLFGHFLYPPPSPFGDTSFIDGP